MTIKIATVSFGISLILGTSSIISLGLCSAGYMTQIVKSGLDAISLSQWESAFTLGYTSFQSLRTAIISSIGVLELTRMGMNIVSREMEPKLIQGTLQGFSGKSGSGKTSLLRCLSQLEKRVSRRGDLSRESFDPLTPAQAARTHGIYEPTSALDPENTDLLVQLLIQFKQQGKGVIISTQDMGFAAQVMDRVIFLSQGSICFEYLPQSQEQCLQDLETFFHSK
ncbi:hypothetical protein ACTFIV_006924 [Dictyostelium citrinum]